MKLTFLGTGTSQGVPVIACNCEVCLSENPKDNRLRTSVLIEHKNTTVVIDTGPDFRQQMLRANVQYLDAVVFTHEHKDHIAGLDDVRAYNFKQNMEMPIYATSQVQSALIREFHYAFSEYKYPGVPELKLHTFDDDAFAIKDLTFTPINVWHYKMPVKGFRIGKLVYLTDVNRIEEAELEKIKGAEIIILDALRKEKHISHYNLEEAIELIEKLKPKKAYLIHISHLMGKHDEVMKELPDFIELAYDGLKLEL
ncbi:MAG: MBL fold metallo-hydrolase [Flavobacteriales bacterium CG18_big_fil_WC_8_21_14_2_50_32_9]|nr:MAG: MBL fold metallo-hydrolase [Flavobacteriales bacterium CG18_big_fil_WC_8_21_14_2_50_32_9]PJC63094.1 MAG: MBL fold metallo-hydrolase [Flavobacteriales bacterium CG_4_9_14_0_2_um_filter_32_27]